LEVQPNIKPLTEEEIRLLSDDAKRLIAARCALRALPLIGYQGHFDFWGDDARQYVLAMEACVLGAIGFQQGKVSDSYAFVTVAASRGAEAAGTLTFGSNNYFPFAGYILYAAHAAAVTASVMSGNYDNNFKATKAVKAINDSVSDTFSLEQQHHDYEFLISAKNTSVIGIDSWNLWTIEIPAYWFDCFARWQRALESIGLEEVYSRYQRLMNGKPDFTLYAEIVDEWHEKYGRQRDGFDSGFEALQDQTYSDPNVSEIVKEKSNNDISAEIITEEEDSSGSLQNSETDYFRPDSDSGSPDRARVGVGQKQASVDDELVNELNASEIVKEEVHLGDGKETKDDSIGESSSEKDDRSEKQDEEKASAFTPYAGGQVTASLDDATTVDHLGRTALVNALRGLLDHNEQPGKLTIGLMGHWGAGKSSVIKMLEKALCDNDRTDHSFICADFDAWAYEHCGNIQAGMAQEVVNGLTKGLGTFAKLQLSWRLATKQHPWKVFSAIVTLIVFAGSMYGLIDWGINWLAGLVGASSVGFIILLWSQLKQVVAHPMAAQLKSYLRLPDFGEHLGLLPVMRLQVAELCDTRLGKGPNDCCLLSIIWIGVV